jgi:phosphoglycerate dehydrogenase-like enzyme
MERWFAMLRVGLPEAVDPALRDLLPKGIELEVIPMEPEKTVQVDFWIPPPYPKQAARAWPYLRGVRVVQSTLAGVDALQKLLPRDVILCDARGVHDIPVAEWVVSAILASLKYFPFYGEVRRSGIWKRRFEAQAQYCSVHPGAQRLYPEVMVEELHGCRTLIVGYGSIGHTIEERLLPFGVEIDRIARTAREGVAGVAQLPEMLPAADIVILIVPFTSETAGLIGERELAFMKPGALLVNAARGPVVNTAALVAALHSGRIRAAVDVTDPEPLPEGHPLWSAPNLLLTPHVAGATPRFMKRAMQFAAAQAGRYLRGEPLENVVTGEY